MAATLANTIIQLAKVPRATKLRRVVQKACRYTLISKNPFRLSLPKVRFLLATLTYTYCACVCY